MSLQHSSNLLFMSPGGDPSSSAVATRCWLSYLSQKLMIKSRAPGCAPTRVRQRPPRRGIAPGAAPLDDGGTREGPVRSSGRGAPTARRRLGAEKLSGGPPDEIGRRGLPLFDVKAAAARRLLPRAVGSKGGIAGPNVDDATVRYFCVVSQRGAHFWPAATSSQCSACLRASSAAS
jgi:hypothetical protein